MVKVRNVKVGTTGGVATSYTNGIKTGQSIYTRRTYSTLEELRVSQGHPYHQLGKPRRKPKFPKPYRGKDPQKKASYAQRRQAYAKRLLRFYKLGPRPDLGGPFESHKILPKPCFHFMVDKKNFGPTSWIISDGCHSASTLAGSTLPLVNPSSAAELAALGAIGVSKSLPTNPLVDMGQFLVELRDLPRVTNPFLWQGKANRFRQLAKNGSSEYLNIQFGWKPFLDDIFDFTKYTLQAQSQIAHYERNSGRDMRRSRKILSTTTTPVTTTITNSPLAGPSPTPSTLATGGSLTRTRHESRRVWFKGSFTYYLPPIDGSVHSYYRRYSAYAAKLYGLRLTPDLLWKVSPWSWAIDWMTNTGHVIRNWSAFSDGSLVMRYGYVMEEKILADVYLLSGYRMSSCASPPLVDTRYEVSRVRQKATPYGFGLNPASFSPFQKGIIAALGINFLAR